MNPIDFFWIIFIRSTFLARLQQPLLPRTTLSLHSTTTQLLKPILPGVFLYHHTIDRSYHASFRSSTIAIPGLRQENNDTRPSQISYCHAVVSDVSLVRQTIYRAGNAHGVHAFLLSQMYHGVYGGQLVLSWCVA